MLGDTNTGKTCLVLRFAEGYYKHAGRSSTIGAFFLTKRLTVKNLTCKMMIWDTAGQEKYQRLAKTYYKSAAAAILCYDVGNPRSLLRLRGWLKELQDSLSSPIVLTIAACKSDLDPVSGLQEEARALADSVKAKYFVTSAKSNVNVAELFQSTAERVLTWQEEAERGLRQPLQISVGKTTPRSSSTPARSHLRSVGSTGPDESDIRKMRSADALKGHGLNTNSDEGSTANESDDITDTTVENRPKVMCEGSLLSCGTADPTKGCIIL